MPFLSVVIPIYNVEAYLRQCIDSVLEQKLDDYELILVDDGSPDNSPQICDEYAEKYPQVKVIHQENGGLSAARNSGLRAAEGKYIVFIDSDDWWNPDVNVEALLALVKKHPETEMFVFAGLDYVEGEGFFDRSDSVRALKEHAFDARSYYKTMLEIGNLQVSAATKILSREHLIANDLFFEQGILGEDNEWMIRVLRTVNKIMILPEPLYICRCGRTGSISNTIKGKNVSDLLHIVENSIEYYQNPASNRQLQEYELCFCAYLWFCALGLCAKVKQSEQEQLWLLFEKTAAVCQYSNSKKTSLAYQTCKLFGVRNTSRILGMYIQLKSNFHLYKKKVNR